MAHGENAQKPNHNGQGKEYWKSRLHRGGEALGRSTKTRTHRKERRLGAMHICSFRSEPGEKECLAAIWSDGRDCKRCDRKCYRAGWDKKRVDRDNRELVRKKQAEIRSASPK